MRGICARTRSDCMIYGTFDDDLVCLVLYNDDDEIVHIYYDSFELGMTDFMKTTLNGS